jgi:hypothetical protein
MRLRPSRWFRDGFFLPEQVLTPTSILGVLPPLQGDFLTFPNMIRVGRKRFSQAVALDEEAIVRCKRDR